LLTAAGSTAHSRFRYVRIMGIGMQREAPRAPRCRPS
jgi:hypothetical protein